MPILDGIYVALPKRRAIFRPVEQNTAILNLIVAVLAFLTALVQAFASKECRSMVLKLLKKCSLRILISLLSKKARLVNALLISILKKLGCLTMSCHALQWVAMVQKKAVEVARHTTFASHTTERKKLSWWGKVAMNGESWLWFLFKKAFVEQNFCVSEKICVL